jgi:MraZ protein
MKMYGKFQHTIDAKGRVFIPARLREKLGDSFYVTISFEDCLTIYSTERWKKAEEKLETMSQTAQMELRQVFANASDVDVDSQGRIPLTQNLRAKAGLKKNVTIVGTGLYVQIWDSETYKPVEEVERDRENLKNVIDKYGF